MPSMSMAKLAALSSASAFAFLLGHYQICHMCKVGRCGELAALEDLHPLLVLIALTLTGLLRDCTEDATGRQTQAEKAERHRKSKASSSQIDLRSESDLC